MNPIELSAISAAISACIAAFAYWTKANHERRRITRTVLYYLLELHHVASRTALVLRKIKDVLKNEIQRALESRNLEYDEAQINAEIEMALPMLARFAFAEMLQSFIENADNYSKALSELARENPVLAFQLRGRDKVILLSQKLEEFMQPVTATSLQSEKEKTFIEHLLLDLSHANLQKSIQKTAWGCDVLTHAKVLMLLRASRKESLPQEDIQKFIDALIGNLYPMTTSS